MALDITPPTWGEAFHDFRLHLQATKAPKTVRFYDVHLRRLIKWADGESIAFDQFGSRRVAGNDAGRAGKFRFLSAG